MDYLSLKAAVAEAAGTFHVSRIADAFQVSVHEVAFTSRKGPVLLLSTDPATGGVYLPRGVDKAWSGPGNLTEFLRSRIRGSTLSRIEMPEAGERIVHLTFAPGWPERKGTPILVVLEVMGRRSNLIVTEGGRILGAAKTVPSDRSRVRPVVPGGRYEPPPPRPGAPIGEITADLLPQPDDPGAAAILAQVVVGLSPFSASQALARASGQGREVLLQVLRGMDRDASGERGFILHSGKRRWLSPFKPVEGDEGGTVDEHEPFSAAALTWKGAVTGGQDRDGEGGDLSGALKAKKERAEAALERLRSERERCLGHAETRRMAEALLVNVSKVKPGSRSVTLPDPHGGTEAVTVPLDPALSPHENANHLFATARRLERGLVELENRESELEKQMEEIREAGTALAERNDAKPAMKIIEADSGGQVVRGSKAPAVYRGPGRRRVVDGFTILVGRSAADNEKVTFQAARPNDLWLHARDYPGSHVVVLAGKRAVPDKVLYAAARLAAEGSGAKNDTSPEIMVTERKWVRKLKGGKPGQVTVERFRSITPRKQEPSPCAKATGDKGSRSQKNKPGIE